MRSPFTGGLRSSMRTWERASSPFVLKTRTDGWGATVFALKSERRQLDLSRRETLGFCEIGGAEGIRRPTREGTCALCCSRRDNWVTLVCSKQEGKGAGRAQEWCRKGAGKVFFFFTDSNPASSSRWRRGRRASRASRASRTSPRYCPMLSCRDAEMAGAGASAARAGDADAESMAAQVA